MRLEQLTGPACRFCGCQDSTVVGESVRWGQPTQRRVCRYCGGQWTVTSPAPVQPLTTPQLDPPIVNRPAIVQYHTVLCPNCRSTHTGVTSTRQKYRWHKCRDCHSTFKSGR